MASSYTIPVITLRPHPEQIQRITAELREIKNGVPRAIAPAINKTLAKGRTTLINGLADLLTAKRGAILGKAGSRRIEVVRASPAHLSGRIKIMSRRIGLINFKVTDTRFAGKQKGGFGSRILKKHGAAAGSGRGVLVQVRKNEPPRLLPKAFIAVGLSNNRHVFERYGVKRKQGKARHLPNIGKMRQPIRSYQGESLHTVWKDSPKLRGQVQGRLLTEFPKDIMSQVDRLLKRKKAKA